MGKFDLREVARPSGPSVSQVQKLIRPEYYVREVTTMSDM